MQRRSGCTLQTQKPRNTEGQSVHALQVSKIVSEGPASLQICMLQINSLYLRALPTSIMTQNLSALLASFNNVLAVYIGCYSHE